MLFIARFDKLVNDFSSFLISRWQKEHKKLNSKSRYKYFSSNLSVAVVKESLMNLRKSDDLPTPNSPQRITFCSGIFTLAMFCSLYVSYASSLVYKPVLLYFHSHRILRQPSARIWKSVEFGLVWVYWGVSKFSYRPLHETKQQASAAMNWSQNSLFLRFT